jgi:hypothetical protein
MDPVSGKLFFYDASRQVHRFYFALFPWSHLHYWEDKGMYLIFATELLGIPVGPQPSQIKSKSNEVESM